MNRNIDVIVNSHLAISSELYDFFNSGLDGIYYLSHASILVSLSGKRFLFDPVLAKPPHLGSWLFYPQMKFHSCLLDVDAVFISHQHQDHFDIDFLSKLSTKTQIFIVSGRPQFNKILSDSGINFIEIPENVIYDLGNGITCLGVNHEYNEIDSAISISNGSFTVYHGNDCFLSNIKLQIFKDNYKKINVACIPFAYVHWYPFLLDNVSVEWRNAEAARLVSKYLDFGLEQIKFLEPDIAIPFGANMFYFDDPDSDHNKAVVSPYDFKRYAISKSFEFREVIHPLFAGDYIICNTNNNQALEIVASDFNEDLLFEGLKSYIAHVRLMGSGFDDKLIPIINALDFSNLDFIRERLSDKNISLNHKIYLSNSDNKSLGFIVIDLSCMDVSHSNFIDYSVPYHHFKLTEIAFRAYLSKKYTFNEIVASSRFRLDRNPNHYNLDVLKIINNLL